ncbi:oligopeptide transport ATP-binding protein oppD [Vibrio ishigakensis]|uniref:ABC-type dipeptide transporter n=1 Tax=Vibrio ishigakensis TaxID=1481914 RepID=A0A0B8P9N8_9VIBR|nr:oligopeptide transport ATP-binding protein oppD [Vibrio ishigakensis]
MSQLLQINDLNVAFKTMQGQKKVLHDVSIDVSKNEILAVVGESGSGKSVMSKAIMGLLGNKASKQGQIFLHDSKLSDKPLEMVSMCRKQAQQIRGDEISMIFQDR